MRCLCAALLVVYASLVSTQSQHAEFFAVVELASPFSDAIASFRDEIQILMDSDAGGGNTLLLVNPDSNVVVAGICNLSRCLGQPPRPAQY